MCEPVPAHNEGQPGEGKGLDIIPCNSFLIEHSVALDSLYANPDFSDVTFMVEGQRLRAHKLVLAARSEYFRQGIASLSLNHVLKGISAVAFRTLLKYIYTGKVELSAFNFEQLVAVLQLSHEYRLVDIQRPIVDYLKENLDIGNVFTILRTSTLLFDDLTESCMQFADQHASDILDSEAGYCDIQFMFYQAVENVAELLDFSTLPQKAVMDMLSRDSFYADETDIFDAICDWISEQPLAKETSPETLIGSFISKRCLRLDLIHPKELLSEVRQAELFETNSPELAQFILDALDRRYQGTVSDMRGCVVLDRNVATAELGATIVEGENRDTLLKAAQGNRENRNTSLTRHKIGETEGIIVQLGRPYTINCVKLEIGDYAGATY
ncbi:unnamed protein product [Heligmosomoides polygyrus]|uniref:BTB domain-containing protein n=1 Tax=Heligmosomoides polygyrus TaxID=6339 RepID=A0A183FWM9_HELPZ|nr:unnamed protein product [Heligmosomoides polygyrus]